MVKRTLNRPRALRKAGIGQITSERVPLPGRADVAAGERVSAVRSRTAGARLTPNRNSVPATQAKNRFGEIIQEARDTGPVFIERHGKAQAVVLGIDAYDKLMSNERSAEERQLDHWTREFDAMRARMQAPQARAAVDALFAATPEELTIRRPRGKS
jgi:prevent-host-death family protein